MAGLVLPGIRTLWLGMALAGAFAPPPLARAAEPQTHRVVIERFTFAPARLEIRAGDAVEWRNRDLAPHTATSGDGEWGTGDLARDGMAAVVFPTPGTFAYLCRHHPRMRGEIVVIAGED